MSLRKILLDTFSKSDIPENIDDLKMGDIDEWDSIGNFNLILAIEQKYGIRFNMEDLDNLKSVKEIKRLLDNDFSK
jgi:acyl carrier protein|tara:strand:- start:1325 stop:1552 length:228 start_codon:yes stop_codon:yes gene_type:complete